MRTGDVDDDGCVDLVTRRQRHASDPAVDSTNSGDLGAERELSADVLARPLKIVGCKLRVRDVGRVGVQTLRADARGIGPELVVIGPLRWTEHRPVEGREPFDQRAEIPVLEGDVELMRRGTPSQG